MGEAFDTKTADIILVGGGLWDALNGGGDLEGDVGTRSFLLGVCCCCLTCMYLLVCLAIFRAVVPHPPLFCSIIEYAPPCPLFCDCLVLGYILCCRLLTSDER